MASNRETLNLLTSALGGMVREASAGPRASAKPWDDMEAAQAAKGAIALLGSPEQQATVRMLVKACAGRDLGPSLQEWVDQQGKA